LAESSLRTEADRVRQRIPNIDNPACRKVLANTLRAACLVQLANVAPCTKVGALNEKKDHQHQCLLMPENWLSVFVAFVAAVF